MNNHEEWNPGQSNSKNNNEYIITLGKVTVNMDLLWEQTRDPYKMMIEIKNNTESSDSIIEFSINKYLIDKNIISEPLPLQNTNKNSINKTIVKLTCEDCGGTMDIDTNRKILMCPFCGSKKILLLDSDKVKIAQIHANTEIEKQRIQTEKEIEKHKEDVKKEEISKKSDTVMFVTIFVFCIFMAIISFLMLNSI